MTFSSTSPTTTTSTSATTQPPAPSDRNRLAAAVVLHDGHVLVVRRSLTERFLPGIWGVPCGKIAAGESTEVAVLRELREETGLTGQVVCAAGERSFVSEWDGRVVCNVQSNFLIRPLGFDVVLPEPDQEYRWLATADLDHADLDEHNLGTIRQALVAQASHALNRRSSQA